MPPAPSPFGMIFRRERHFSGAAVYKNNCALFAKPAELPRRMSDLRYSLKRQRAARTRYASYPMMLRFMMV